MDAPQVPSPPDSVIGQIAGAIVFAVATLGAIVTAISRYFQKRREAHPDDVRRSDTIELIDSARIKYDLDRILDGLFGGDGKPPGLVAKIDQALDDLLHLKNEQEIARRAREEVARLLLEERNRQPR